MIDEKRLIENIEKEFDGVCVYDVSPSQAVADFVEIVDRQPKVGEWIPCSHLLPLDGVNVLITDEYNNMSVGYLEIGMRRWHDIYDCIILDEIIAWQPLPEPYTLPEPYKGE